MNRLRAWADRLGAWALHTEGSTRSSALIRIGLAATLWTRWGRDLMPAHNPSFPWPFWLALSASFYLSTTLMFAGLFSRPAAVWAGLTALTLYGVGGQADPVVWVSHHTYLLAFATLLCGLTPCGSSYSLDRWRAVRRAGRRGQAPPPERGNLWGLRLIALQVTAVYLWSALSKLNGRFLSGPSLEYAFLSTYLTPRPVPLPGFGAVVVGLAWITVALEVAVGVGMLFPRVRRWVVLPGLGMHAAFYVLLPVRTFSVTMWILYLAYFDADAVHEVIGRMEGEPPEGTGSHAPPDPQTRGWS